MSLSAGVRMRLEVAAKAFLVVMFVGSVGVGLARLNQRAHDDPQNQVDLGSWSVVSKPDWATDDDVRAVRDAAALRGWQTPLLDSASGGVVVGAISAVPAVRSVVALRKVYPNAYDAVIELRRPVAAVQLAGTPARYVEVDEEGVALSTPHLVRPVREGRALRVIVGGGPIRPGARFGADVVAAAVLCADLGGCGSSAVDPASRDDGPLLNPLDVIDVTNFGGRKNSGESEVCLRMSGYVLPATPSAPSVAPSNRANPANLAPRSHCIVEWGRLAAVRVGEEPSPRDALEPTFGAKVGRLLRVLSRSPDLDGLSVVRVAFNDVVVVPIPARSRR